MDGDEIATAGRERKHEGRDEEGRGMKKGPIHIPPIQTDGRENKSRMNQRRTNERTNILNAFPALSDDGALTRTVHHDFGPAPGRQNPGG